jgi:hypothetical protein
MLPEKIFVAKEATDLIAIAIKSTSTTTTVRRIKRRHKATSRGELQVIKLGFRHAP